MKASIALVVSDNDYNEFVKVWCVCAFIVWIGHHLAFFGGHFLASTTSGGPRVLSRRRGSNPAPTGHFHGAVEHACWCDTKQTTLTVVPMDWLWHAWHLSTLISGIFFLLICFWRSPILVSHRRHCTSQNPVLIHLACNRGNLMSGYVTRASYCSLYDTVSIGYWRRWLHTCPTTASNIDQQTKIKKNRNKKYQTRGRRDRC